MQLRSPFRRSGEGFAVARWDFGLRWRSRPVMVDAGRLCSSRAIPKRVGGVVGDLRVMSRRTVLSPCSALCHFMPCTSTFAISPCHLMAVDNALCHLVR